MMRFDVTIGVGDQRARAPLSQLVRERLRTIITGLHLREGRAVVAPVARGHHDPSRPRAVDGVARDITERPGRERRHHAVLSAQQLARLRGDRLALHARAQVVVHQHPPVLPLAGDVPAADAAGPGAGGDAGPQAAAAPLGHHPLHVAVRHVQARRVEDHLPLPRVLAPAPAPGAGPPWLGPVALPGGLAPDAGLEALPGVAGPKSRLAVGRHDGLARGQLAADVTELDPASPAAGMLARAPWT